MATRKVKFYFTATGFMVEYEITELVDHEPQPSARKSHEMKVMAGVISASPTSQEKDNDWIVVSSRRTKGRNTAITRENTPPGKVKGPVTRRAARNNFELAPPALYLKRSFPSPTAQIAQQDEEGRKIVTPTRGSISPSTGSIMRSVIRHSPASIIQSCHSSKTERPFTPKGLSISSIMTVKSSSTESLRIQENKGKATATSEDFKQTHTLRMPQFESVSLSKRQYSGFKSNNNSSSSTAPAVRRSLPPSISRHSKYKETESLSDINRPNQIPLNEHVAKEVPKIPTVTAVNNTELQEERPQQQAFRFQEPTPNITQNITQDKIRQMVVESIHLENERSQNQKF